MRESAGDLFSFLCSSPCPNEVLFQRFLHFSTMSRFQMSCLWKANRDDKLRCSPSTIIGMSVFSHSSESNLFGNRLCNPRSDGGNLSCCRSSHKDEKNPTLVFESKSIAVFFKGADMFFVQSALS